MTVVPDSIVQQFAAEFAGKDQGFSFSEIVDYFRRYSPSVPDQGSFRITPPRLSFFADCLRLLEGTDQWRSLVTLCNDPPSMKYPGPTLERRNLMKQELFSRCGGVPLGVLVSEIDVVNLQSSWLEAIYRLVFSAAASTTAARTMLEQTCKTILVERQYADPDDSKGDLGKLVSVVSKQLSLDGAKRQVVSGLVTVCNAVASITNDAGDRHGISSTAFGGVKDAELVVNACGTLAVYLVREHYENRI